MEDQKTQTQITPKTIMYMVLFGIGILIATQLIPEPTIPEGTREVCYWIPEKYSDQEVFGRIVAIGGYNITMNGESTEEWMNRLLQQNNQSDTGFGQTIT